jgi:hypothetical protein
MWAPRVLCACAFALSLLAWVSPASAYAWMIRHGYGGCTTCHADPSGGELLTQYGRVQGDLILRMRYGSDKVSAQSSTAGEGETESYDEFDSFDEQGAGGARKKKPDDGAAGPKNAFQDDDVEDLDEEDIERDKRKGQPQNEEQQAPVKAREEEAPTETSEGPSSAAGFMWGLIDLPPALLLGGSYRHLNIYQDGEFETFPMQMDLYGQLSFGSVRIGGTLGLAKVPAGSPHARAAQVTTNQGDQWNLISRTHWIGYDFGDRKEFALRAGRLNLPFGIRIPEHVMWVREATRTDRESDQQHGVALAYNGPLFRGEAMAIAGNFQVNPDRYRERGYSAYVETWVTEPFATGVSSLLTRASEDITTLDTETTIRGAHGVFTRLTVSEPLVVFIEANALHRSRRELGYVGFLQIDFEAVQGLHLMATGEVLDNGYRQAEDPATGLDIERQPGTGEPRWGGWLSVDWFFLPHLEARVDAIARQDDPFALMAQLHAYL